MKVIVHCSLAHIHATSIRAPSRHAGHKNAAARRSVPTAAPLSLKPDEQFQPQRWLKLAGLGGHWLGLDVPSTGTACGAIGGATETHGDLW